MLELRARVFAGIRSFFAARGVLEVDTPQLSRAAALEPALHSLTVPVAGQTWYLHTSPESAMKRLLAAGSGDIYQLCHVFRDAEQGRHHNREFMLLEWYRTGTELHALMREVTALLQSLDAERFAAAPVQVISYRELFTAGLGIDPITEPTPTLRERAHALEGASPALADDDHDGWLDWLLGAHLQPRLPAGTLTFVHAYPPSQAALAALSPDGNTAERFELFYGPLELANGYHELRDAAELRERFARDLATRAARGLAPLPSDQRLLDALPKLPDCCGVALGIDRLLMVLAGAASIDQVIAFAGERA